MVRRAARCRISTLLVERQLFADERTSAAWVLARKVLADGRRVDKPGDEVPISADIRVRGLDNPYVSRGGLKLRGALADFSRRTGCRTPTLTTGTAVGPNARQLRQT